MQGNFLSSFLVHGPLCPGLETQNLKDPVSFRADATHQTLSLPSEQRDQNGY